MRDDDDDATTRERFTLSNFLNAFRIRNENRLYPRDASRRDGCLRAFIWLFRRRHHFRRDLSRYVLLVNLDCIRCKTSIILFPCPWHVSIEFRTNLVLVILRLISTSISPSRRFTRLSPHSQILLVWDSDRFVLLARTRHRLPRSQAR